MYATARSLFWQTRVACSTTVNRLGSFQYRTVKARQTGGGGQLIIVCSLLKIETINRIGLSEGLKIFQCAAGGLVDVAGISARLEKSLQSCARNAFRIEPALLRERFEQNQRAVAVMGLISGFFPEMVMPFFRSFKSVDATRDKAVGVRSRS